MEDFRSLQSAARERMCPLEARLKEIAPIISLDPEQQEPGHPEKYTIAPDFVRNNNNTLKNENRSMLPEYNKYVLLYFISTFSPDKGRYALPPSIVTLYPREIKRILRQTDSLEDSFFDLSNDLFLKDLAIVSHRLIPVGAEFAEGGSGVPRRLIFAAGPSQFFYLLWCITFRCGGFRPFFALHTHLLSLDDFNQEGWEATYHRLAQLLELNPQMKGWLSSSWFLDPALEAISPHLVHLRKVPTDNGGMLLFVGRDPEGTSGALAKSPTRRRLFAEGKYVPAIYMRVWPRRALMDWSRQRQEDERAKESLKL